MSTKTLVTRSRNRTLNSKSRAVLDLMLKYADEHGNLAPEKLDAAEPGWDDRFPSRRWAVKVMARLRNRGRFAWEKQQREAQSANGFGNRGNDGQNTELTPLEKAIQESYHEFKGKGAANGHGWELFRKKYPDLSKEMDYSGHPSLRASQLLTRMKKRGLLTEAPAPQPPKVKRKYVKKAKAHTNGHDANADVEALVHARVAAILAEAGHCPRCGKNLETLFHATVLEARQRAGL